jgi:DNA-binding XRE family transcriptional regulator
MVNLESRSQANRDDANVASVPARAVRANSQLNGSTPVLNLPTPSDIARQVRELRGRAHITQADLSRLTGVATSDICRFELGRSAPTLRTLEKIAVALGVRVVLVPRDQPNGRLEGEAASERDSA